MATDSHPSIPDLRLKRLLFRSTHRGSKETDIIVGDYARDQLESMNPQELDVFEAFLEEADADIWHWVTTNGMSADPRFHPLIIALRARYALV